MLFLKKERIDFEEILTLSIYHPKTWSFSEKNIYFSIDKTSLLNYTDGELVY